jgi:hypothetical protein
MLIHFRLVHAGYGSLAEVRELDARTVLQAMHYDDFRADYERKFMELNQT